MAGRQRIHAPHAIIYRRVTEAPRGGAIAPARWGALIGSKHSSVTASGQGNRHAAGSVPGLGSRDTASIRRQYDELIAAHYDRDPQSLTTDSLDRALEQLEAAGVLDGSDPLKVLDLGMGTGMFLDRLRAKCQRALIPFGLDISSGMLEAARQKFPNLCSAVDDAARLEDHFAGHRFDLVCTHFITGFVPIAHLAPRIWNKLRPGGWWSFVGGTSAGYRALQEKANNPLLRLLVGRRKVSLDDLILPADQAAVVATFSAHRFERHGAETFQPQLNFPDFDRFMDFAYHGGWLTPFVEKAGLQRAGKTARMILNKFFFPLRDHHCIVLALGRKPFIPESSPCVSP